jgi:amidohydrolase
VVRATAWDRCVVTSTPTSGELHRTDASHAGDRLSRHIEELTAGLEHELIAFRRNLHMHPELSRQEHRTTEELAERLRLEGLDPHVLGAGTGLVCDVDLRAPDARASRPAGIVALRADIDGLAMQEDSTAAHRSRVSGSAHACGHDVHAAVILGAGLNLAVLAREHHLDGIVRLIFEPAEEQIPSGAVDVIDEGWLDGVDRIFGLHCEPKIDVGRIGTRVGPITAASDQFELRLTGPGGHTARPNLTLDLVRIMATAILEIPDQVDDAAPDGTSISVVFGFAHTGDAANVIPSMAVARGSVRTRDFDAWSQCEDLFRDACDRVLRPTGVTWQVDYGRGVPPVVNDATCTELLGKGAAAILGAASVVEAPASMGGDSFAWYTQVIPGAYGRLGTHSEAVGEPVDLHASRFDVDERAIVIGVNVLVRTCVLALAT